MFLYFLPELRQEQGDFVLDFEPYGLGVSLADIKKAPDDATVFPIRIDGVDGAIVVPNVNGAVPNSTAYRPDKQTWNWYEVNGRRVGVGFEVRPTPVSLARPRTYDGLFVTDCSGQKWVIPIARSPSRCTLPSDYDFDPITFEAVSRPSSDFDQLWKIANEIYDHWNLTTFTLPKAKLASYALRALSVNYRVGPLELRALDSAGLKVLDDNVVAFACLALIDWQMSDEVKKNVTANSKQSQAEDS